MSVEQLSLDIKEQIKDGYLPSPDRARLLARIPLGVMIGAVGSGKTSIQRGLEAANPHFKRVVSRVTRDMREDETPGSYHFEPHTESHLTHIKHAVEEGTLAQVAVHPSGHVYYSRPEDYGRGADIPILTAMGGKVTEDLRRIFPSSNELTVVVPADDLIERLYSGSTPRKNPHERLIESADSLAWATYQKDMLWVPNPNGGLEQAIVDVRACFVQGVQPSSDQEKGRRMAEDMVDILSAEAMKYAS